MATVATSVRIDPKVKSEAQSLAKELGMNLSTVVNAYLSQFVRERRLSVGIDEEWFDRSTQAKILAAIASVGTSDWMEFENGEKLLSHLRSLESPGTVMK